MTKEHLFKKGNNFGKGRKLGSRNKVTARTLKRVLDRSEAGLKVEDLLLDLVFDKKVKDKLRIKAATTVSNMIYNGVDEDYDFALPPITKEQIDEYIKRCTSK